MTYTFESFDTEIVNGKLSLPRNLLNTADGTIMVFPSPYMVVRISDQAHFDAVIDSTERLPENHRRTIRQLMYAKSVTASSTSSAAHAILALMKDIYKGKADFSDRSAVIPIRVENCGEYVQITVKE